MRQAPKEAGTRSVAILFPGTRNEAVSIMKAEEKSSEFCVFGMGRETGGNLPRRRRAQLY
ncbi:hypothetical protein OIN60_00170 [Paenibacillus sp. P96]|uniref:Uncharacterized protein n=1 Tax=Paenibacillus zeirhizosphaerae TaxID=2987519 RepID=A0ABT9FKG9_9BACL|nr:hypothetical protein [Paenibacillus sp. P96]MDP4095205.1 hypothetical protein [Paenibacillus sp. P96]